VNVIAIARKSVKLFKGHYTRQAIRSLSRPACGSLGSRRGVTNCSTQVGAPSNNPGLERAFPNSCADPKIASLCGSTNQAVREAQIAARCGYDIGLLSLGALRHASTQELIQHVCTVASVIPVFGFSLQPSVGGRLLPYDFWGRFAEIDNVIAIKIASFNLKDARIEVGVS